MKAAVSWGRDLARDLQAVAAGQLDWTDVDRGCLLSGPPGVGKTLFARALAASCGVPLIVGSYGEWHGSGGAHQGDLLKSMHKTFEQAREKVPSIVFIDEIDSFPDRAKVTHRYASWEIQVVNSLLAEIDGVRERQGVIVLGACNHAHMLDPALTRAGRLDRHIEIGLPDRGELALILREHLGADLSGEPLNEAARSVMGMTGADCERLVRGARRRARVAGRAMIADDLISESAGAQECTEDEMWTMAIHEAGHAAAACRFLRGRLASVSICHDVRKGGETVLFDQDIFLRKHDLHVRLVVHLAGAGG